MNTLDRITFHSSIIGGKPCIRGMQVIVGLIASGKASREILTLYPYLEEDIHQALQYATWRSEEREIELQKA